MNPVSDIRLTINASPKSLIRFDPNIKSYEAAIPTDCFGVLLRLDYNPEFYISIRADRDAGRFGYAGIEPEMGEYIAGSEIPYDDFFGGYIIRLDKREACFEEDLDVNVTIDAGSSMHGTDQYRIHIHRDCGKRVRELFDERAFYDEEYGIEMPYMLYVPTDYDPARKYPMVICLHGTGEIQEPISAVLKKTQMATVFAEDSESGRNQCVVLVPKCGIRYDEDDNWTTLNQFIRKRSDSPFWPMPQLTVAWRLIQKIETEYSVDVRRRYLTGISSGAFGAYVLAMDHPDSFSAMVIACGAANPQRIMALKNTPLWIFHSADDPLIVPAYTLDPTLAALDGAGIKYRVTRYPEKQVFWQSPHFCWEVVYKDEQMREWLFSQRIGGWKHLKKRIGVSSGDNKLGQAISDEVSDIAAQAIAAATDAEAI